MLPKPKPEVVSCTLPDGAVLFSPVRESYFGLNETGARIWEHLSSDCSTVEQLCRELERQFPDAEPQRVQLEVRRLLESLAEKGLLESR
jgi:Coenzyme PQQ synthesis protein D (PqqD)